MAGRPSKYKEEYSIQAFKLAILGAIDKEMAEFFNVTESTLNLWKKKHSEFSESIKKGKEVADINVASSLYKKAIGHKETLKKAFKVKETKNGIGSTEKVEIVDVEEYYPPETTAIIFWLKNRQPGKWRDAKVLQGDEEKPLNQVTVFSLPDNNRD